MLTANHFLKATYLLLPISCFLLPMYATAQNDSIWRDVDLQQVVVTGTRTQKVLKDVPIQTRLISSKDIAKLDATNIEDLLQQELPGVEFSYAMNQQTHFNFAGFGGQSVLFLVDGERLAGETMDDVDFSRLSMSNVERIEIIKGAASALYGSSAAGGVINIITKTPREPWTLNVNGRYGTHNNQRYGISFGLNGKHWQNMLNVTRTAIDSYDVTNGDKAQAVTQFMVDRYYGDKTWNFNDKLTWRPMTGLRLTANVGYYFRDKATTTPALPDHYRDYTAGIKGFWDITERDNLQLSYNFDQYDKAQHNQLTDKCLRNYSNVQNTIRGLYTHEFRNAEDETCGALTFGGDFMYDYMLNTKTADGEYNQKSFDVFGQYDWTLSHQLEVVGAVRYDYFSQGNTSQVTPKLNLRYSPFADTKNAFTSLTLRAGYGMGFRAPTLKEKYYIFNMAGIWDVVGSNITGNDLVPELSHNFNISADWLYNGYNITFSTYYNIIKNRITTGAPQDISTFPGDKTQLGTQRWLPYINVPKYNSCGFDLSVQKRWQCGFGTKLQYAYVHEQLVKDDDGEAINNQYQPARPHSLTARFDWDHQFTTNYGLNIAVNGKVMSAVDNIEFVDYVTVDATTGRLARTNVHYPAYTMWKLLVTQRIAKAFKLTATVDNIFNYNPKYHYFNSPFTDGTSFLVGLSIDLAP